MKKTKQYLYILALITLIASSSVLFSSCTVYLNEESISYETDIEKTTDEEESEKEYASSDESESALFDIPESNDTDTVSDISDVSDVTRNIGEIPAHPDEFFTDSLFIGDSRTIGLREYSSIEGAMYFASTGMSVYRVHSEIVSIPGIGDVNLDSLLSSRQFGKIYIMLGINELGYSFDSSAALYGKLIEDIRAYQPNAKIIIEANLHVTKEKSLSDGIINNMKIDEYNSRIALLADGVNVFYIDVNTVFDDAEGNLSDEYAYDPSHVYGKYYSVWSDWIASQNIGY